MISNLMTGKLRLAPVLMHTFRPVLVLVYESSKMYVLSRLRTMYIQVVLPIGTRLSIVDRQGGVSGISMHDTTLIRELLVMHE